MTTRNWTREELIVAFNLYCRIPFAKAVQTNPEVIEVARLIDRSPGAVAFKLGNFGSFDPELKKRGVGGLPNASKLDRQIWDEFHNDWNELGYQSELIIAKLAAVPVDVEPRELHEFPPGGEREQIVKARVNQAFFRRVILSDYAERCCVTGLAMPALLVASHIVPWKLDASNRTNPHNGLCLNVLHDRAFDLGLLTITPQYQVKISRSVGADNRFTSNSLLKYNSSTIALPEKFQPSKEFLEFHNRHVFVD